MIVHAVHVENLGPISKWAAHFNPSLNAIVGINGCGKTHVLATLAGILGTDDATSILSSFKDFGSITVDVFTRTGEELSFEASGKFDLEAVAEFKSKLDERVNFPLTEWSKNYCSRTIDAFQARLLFRSILGSQADRVFMKQRDGAVRFVSGDGFHRILETCCGMGEAGVPTLLESPDRHLDLMNQRILADFLDFHDRQVIFTTHSPCMISSGENVISM